MIVLVAYKANCLYFSKPSTNLNSQNLVNQIGYTLLLQKISRDSLRCSVVSLWRQSRLWDRGDQGTSRRIPQRLSN